MPYATGSTVLSRRQIEECIAAQRGPRRVSQAKLAARFGVTQTTISDWVRGHVDAHPCRTRYADATREEARRLHVVEGLDYAAIARKLGTTRTTIQRWLGPAPKSSEPTVTARLKAMVRRGYRRTYTREHVRMVRELRTKQKLSYSAIALATGIPVRTVGRWLCGYDTKGTR